MSEWDEMDDDMKAEHFAEVLRRIQEMPAEHKVWNSLREYLNELAMRRVLHDPTKLYTKNEALMLYVQELRDRPGEELLEFLQRVDPMWDAYDWDDETELFVPTTPR